MSILEEMKDSLFSAGKEVSQKAKEVSGVAKLKLDMKSKEDFVNKHYQELGRLYYEEHKDEEEPERGEELLAIREALEEIEQMKEEILNIQGAAECPVCGVKVPADAAFCSSCGAKISGTPEEDAE